MPLTQNQIDEFTRRAKIAGLDDNQIQQEISKKVAEFNQTNNLVQPSTPTKPNPIVATTPSTGTSETSSQNDNFISRFISGIIQPAVDYGKLVGESVYQGGKYVFDPTFRKLVNGETLTPEELAKVNTDTAFYTKDEAQKKLGTGKDIAITGAKAAAGMESYFIPFGKGANIATKALIPGAVSGAMAEISKEGATAKSVLEAGATSALTAGAVEGIGNMISWTKDQSGNLVRESQNLDEATRKINVKASVYGASKEKAINGVLDKYGFKGTAQAQYGMLEPTMNDIENKIQTFVKDNPNLSVDIQDIKKSFMDKMSSSLRTKDLTKKDAITEISGYLNDLLKSSEGSANVLTEKAGGGGASRIISIEKLREMKKVLNQDYGAVFKKMESNTPLNSREKVIAAAWDSLDDAVKNVAPELKSLLTDESMLYQAAPSLHAARVNPPTFRFMGTSVPAGVTQKLRDLGSSTLKTLGIVADKLPDTPEALQPIITKIAALTPEALKGQGVSDSDISKIQDLQTSLQSGGMPGNQPTPSISARPSPQNPFGGLSKRQVLSLALTQGASYSDLEQVGKMYDMLASDPSVVDSESQKTADNLRTEYFKRTTDNKFLDAVNNYNKVTNTSDTAQGDISLIFAFMKMLDPTSVVREGEFATAEQTASIPTQLVNQYNKALTGQRLSPEQRAAYRKEATRIFQVYQQRQAPIDAYYQGLAQRYGIDPSLIGVGLYSQSK